MQAIFGAWYICLLLLVGFCAGGEVEQDSDSISLEDISFPIANKAELLGKKLLSYPTLVQILKARNNATRPILSQETGKEVMGTDSSKTSSETAPVSNKLCSPASREKTTQIQKLCAGQRRRNKNDEMTGEDAALCVTIIPGDTADDREIVTYTDCEMVNNLFKVLAKSEAIPKCYDCGS